jgi:hypothetical protein
VARRIEQIDHVPVIGKLHDRRGHRNTALLFQRHPIRRRMPRRLAPLDGARQLNGAAEQQQLFRQRGLARVRMADDGKSPSFADFSGT